MQSRTRTTPIRIAPAVLVTVATLVGSGALPGVLAAADPDRTSKIDESVTVLERPLAAATSAVTVLDRAAIEALDVASVAELMRFIPGLDISSGGGRAGFATVQVRGGDPNFTAVLLDGVPLNDATDPFGGGVNLNSLSVAHIERIEVVRGPLSSVFGSTGLSGAVNIVTRSGGDGTGYSVGLAAGDASALLFDAALSGGGETPYFLGVTWEEEEERIADERFEQLAVSGNARFSVGDDTLSIQGRVSLWESDDYPEGSGGPILGTGDLRESDNEELSAGLRFDGDRNRGYFDVYRHELDRDNPLIPPDASDPFNSVPASSESSTYTHVIAGWAHTLLADEKQQLRVGGELDWEDGDNDGIQQVPPPFPTDTSYDLDRWSAGAFIEWIRTRGPLTVELTARIDEPEKEDTQFGPRAGLTYRIGESGTRLRFSAGRSFKVPSFYALGNPSVGNPALEPEEVVGADVGVIHDSAAGLLRTEFNVFWYTYDDLIDFDFMTFSLINRSEVESRGAEAGLAWKVRDDLDLSANVTYTDVEDQDTGEALLRRPEWVGSVAATWRPAERWSWTVDMRVVSDSLDRQIPAPTRDSVAGYTLWGTSLAYRVAKRWQLHARVDNAGDKDYETLIGFPGAETSFRAGLRFRSR